MALQFLHFLKVHTDNDSVVFRDDDGRFVAHNWQGEIGRFLDLAACEKALREAKRPPPRPKPQKSKKKLNDGVAPLPSDVLTLADAGWAMRRRLGENAFAVAVAYRTLDGRIIAAAGGKAIPCATSSEARSKTYDALREDEARKRTERAARRRRPLPESPEESPEGEL